MWLRQGGTGIGYQLVQVWIEFIGKGECPFDHQGKIIAMFPHERCHDVILGMCAIKDTIGYCFDAFIVQ